MCLRCGDLSARLLSSTERCCAITRRGLRRTATTQTNYTWRLHSAFWSNSHHSRCTVAVFLWFVAFSNGRDNGIVDWWMGRLCWSSDKETTGLVVLQRLLSHAKCHLPYLKATGLLVIGGESLRPRHFTMLLVLLVLWQVLVACGQRCGVVSVMCLWSGFHLEGCLPKSAN